MTRFGRVGVQVCSPTKLKKNKLKAEQELPGLWPHGKLKDSDQLLNCCVCRLGKTIQVISFLAGMFDAKLIRRVLIVMPVSVMPNWENEFNKW